MNSVLGSTFFKTSVLLLPFVFAACTTEESSWLERSDSYGNRLYERHLKKGSNASFDCYVYSQGDHVTLEMIYDLPMYDANLNTIYDIEAGDPSYYYVDVMMTGVFQSEATEACESIKESIEGMEMSCSKSRVRGRAELASVNEFSKSLILGNMVPQFKSQCDDFYDTYKGLMSEVPGKWDYGRSEDSQPALSCDVNMSNDSLFVNAQFPDRSFSMVLSEYLYEGEPLGYFMAVENYTGVSADTLAKVCTAYRSESELVSVNCTGSSIAYLVSNTQEDQVLTLEDMAVYMKKQVCDGFLDGSYTLEDMWFEN